MDEQETPAGEQETPAGDYAASQAAPRPQARHQSMPFPMAAPQQAVAQPAAPPYMPEWSKATEIQMDRLHAGLADIDNQEFSGEIDAMQAHELRQQIQPRLQLLTKSQEAAQQKQEAEANQKMMQQTAQQEAMRSQHQQYHAKAFQSTVALFVDPLTGKAEHFYQDAKGNWKPIEYLAHHKELESLAPARQVAGEIQQNETAQPSVIAAAGQEAPPTDETPPKTGVADLPEAKPEGGDTGTIGTQAQTGEPSPISLDDFAKQAYAPSTPAKTGVEPAKEDWHTVRSASGQETAGLARTPEQWNKMSEEKQRQHLLEKQTEHPIAEMFKRAAQALPKPNTAGLNPVEAAHVIQQWRQQQVGLVTHMYSEHEHGKRTKEAHAQAGELAQRQQAFQEKLHATDIKAKAEEQRKTDAAKAEASAKDDYNEVMGNYNKKVEYHLGLIQKDAKAQHDAAAGITDPKLRKEAEGKIDPAYASHETQMDLARTRAQDDFKHLGDVFGGAAKKASSQVSGPSANAQAMAKKLAERQEQAGKPQAKNVPEGVGNLGAGESAAGPAVDRRPHYVTKEGNRIVHHGNLHQSRYEMFKARGEDVSDATPGTVDEINSRLKKPEETEEAPGFFSSVKENREYEARKKVGTLLKKKDTAPGFFSTPQERRDYNLRQQEKKKE